MGHDRTAALTVSVVVPLHNGRELIRDCLRSVPDEVELLVVDDASTDGAPAVVESEFPRAILLTTPWNVGFGAAANLGLASCSGSVCVVLNSDARLRPGALARIVDAFLDERVGIVGPRLVFPDGSHQTSAASFPGLGSILCGAFLLNEVYRAAFPKRRFRWELGMAQRDHAMDHDVDWVMGTCIAIRSACLEQIHGFDEGYFLYAEETDLCWRAQAAGWRVRYVAGALVEHLGGGSTGDPVVHARRSMRSEARFMARAYGEDQLGWWRLTRATGAVIKVPLLALAAPFDRRVRDRLRWQLAALRAVLSTGPRTRFR